MNNKQIQTPFTTCRSSKQTTLSSIHDTTVYAAIVELLLELEGSEDLRALHAELPQGGK